MGSSGAFEANGDTWTMSGNRWTLAEKVVEKGSCGLGRLWRLGESFQTRC